MSLRESLIRPRDIMRDRQCIEPRQMLFLHTPEAQETTPLVCFSLFTYRCLIQWTRIGDKPIRPTPADNVLIYIYSYAFRMQSHMSRPDKVNGTAYL